MSGMRTESCLQDVSCGSNPFVRHKYVYKKMFKFMRGTSLGTVRKMTPLTTSALGDITKNTFVGGFGMLQVSMAVPTCVHSAQTSDAAP